MKSDQLIFKIFFQNPLGILLTSLLPIYIAGYSFRNPYIVLFFSLTIFVSIYFTRKIFLLFAVFAFVNLVFFGIGFSTNRTLYYPNVFANFLYREYGGMITIPNLTFFIYSFVVVAIFFCFTKVLHDLIKESEFLNRYYSYIFVGFPLICCALMPWVAQSLSLVSFIVILFLLITIKSTWMSGLVFASGSNWTNLFTHVLPFWTLEPVPSWNVEKLKTTDDEIACRVEGLKYIFRATLAILFWRLFWDCIFSDRFSFSLNWPNYVNAGVESFIQLEYSRLYCWFVILMNAARWVFLVLAVYTNFIVGIFRLLGFRMSYQWDNPWKANTFNEFMSRILLGYTKIVQVFFLYPIISHLRFMRRYKNARMFIAIFFAALLGGALVHFFRNIYTILFFGFIPALTIYIKGHLFYMSSIALACAYSATPGNPIGRWKILNKLVIFVVYATMLVLASNYDVEDISTKLRFLKYIFLGISK